MTKVGVYAMLRVYVLIFGANAGAAAWIAEPFVLPAAAVTLAVGMIGVLASRTLTSLASFALIGSVGTLLAVIFTESSASACALLSGAQHARRCGTVPAGRLVRVAAAAPATSWWPHPGGQLDLLAGLFFLAAIATVGLPPLSASSASCWCWRR